MIIGGWLLGAALMSYQGQAQPAGLGHGRGWAVPSGQRAVSHHGLPRNQQVAVGVTAHPPSGAATDRISNGGPARVRACSNIAHSCRTGKKVRLGAVCITVASRRIVFCTSRRNSGLAAFDLGGIRRHDAVAPLVFTLRRQG